MDYETKILNSKNIPDLFEVVKKVVKEFSGKDQAGLMLGLSNLGIGGKAFIGAYYSLEANMIVINKQPLKRIRETNPSIYRYYLFHVILHEYMHSIGVYDENEARQLVYNLTLNYFGSDHILTQFASNLEKFMPNLTYPNIDFIQPSNINIEFVKGIDRNNINYIG